MLLGSVVLLLGGYFHFTGTGLLKSDQKSIF